MSLKKVAEKHTPRLKVKFIKKGICYADNGIIVVRKPYSRANLFEYLHECAHAVLGHLKGSLTRYREEYEADQYVRRVFSAEHLKVPPNTDKRQRWLRSKGVNFSGLNTLETPMLEKLAILKEVV